MKTILLLFIVFLQACNTGHSQNAEFKKYNNGLIYTEPAVNKLKHIVDSLNLKFRVCGLPKTYMSIQQGRAYYIEYKGKYQNEASKDMKANMPFEAFLKKYGISKPGAEVLVVKHKYKDYEGRNVIQFTTIGLHDDYSVKVSKDPAWEMANRSLKGHWVYTQYEKSSYQKGSIDAFYFIDELVSQPLTTNYARLVQYSECMIDTTSQVYSNKASFYYGRRHDSMSFVKIFTDYTDSLSHRPKYSEENYHQFIVDVKIWDSLRFKTLDSAYAHDKNFKDKLANAVNEALTKGSSDDEFEEYVGRYYSSKTELELKRNRRVIGGCSMDQSPRIHALNIAKLSAETVSWEVFLRAHLDIMNDRFERASDGSYAYAKRQTYIKELEVLDINVNDLLLGISLRLENTGENHYYGSINRLGRALAESEHADEISARMLNMIADKQLDLYNRVLIYYLYSNCNYYTENKDIKAENEKKLALAVSTLPAYLSTKK